MRARAGKKVKQRERQRKGVEGGSKGKREKVAETASSSRSRWEQKPPLLLCSSSSCFSYTSPLLRPRENREPEKERRSVSRSLREGIAPGSPHHCDFLHV